MSGGRLIRQKIRQPRRVAARLSAGARVPGCRESRDKRILATLGKVPQTCVSSKTNDWRIRQMLGAAARGGRISAAIDYAIGRCRASPRAQFGAGVRMVEDT